MTHLHENCKGDFEDERDPNLGNRSPNKNLAGKNLLINECNSNKYVFAVLQCYRQRYIKYVKNY